jgi:hypothetical protein
MSKKASLRKPFAAHSGAIENVLSRMYSLDDSVYSTALKTVSLAEFRAFELVSPSRPEEPMQDLLASGIRRGQSISLNHQLTAIFALGENATVHNSQLAGTPVSVIARDVVFAVLLISRELSHITIYSDNKFILRGKTLAPRACGFEGARLVYFK